MKLLDCTLRDGGYYNQWDYAPDVVESYLEAMALSGIDFVEIGLRLPPQPRFMGAFAYCADAQLRSLEIPAKLNLGVMVNAKDLIHWKPPNASGGEAAVDALFAEASDSPVSLVRVAAHFSEITASAPATRRLKALGYRVGFNFMQSGGKSEVELAQAAAEVASWDCVDVLYFADSLGNMRPDDVAQTVKALRKAWPGDLGIHTHDNKGLALVNTFAALESGVSWLDATVLGMGRGAGNARMEHLLIELARKGEEQYSPESVFPLVMGPFRKLQESYGWGPGLLYYLSATYGVHPTYVQEMLGRGQYDPHQIITALEFLKNSAASFYTAAGLEEALVTYSDDSEGTWSPKGWAEGEDLLVVGAGASVRAHHAALLRFADRKRARVISLNTTTDFSSDRIDAYAAAHRLRFMTEATRYQRLRKPLICPLTAVPEPTRALLGDVRVLNYGMSVKRDRFVAGEKSCTVPVPLTFAYVLAVAMASGARTVYLAGFDGYAETDPKQHEMKYLLDVYGRQTGHVPLIALTPTTYPVTQSSVYAPDPEA